MNENYTPMQRVLAALSHKEPDRVPLFLMLSLRGARELGMSPKNYFSKAENVIKGQLLMQKKYSNDCFYPFFYGPIEVEAMGGEVIYNDEGPANAGRPIFKNPEDIKKFQPPKVSDSPRLLEVLKAVEALNKASSGATPIIGVAMSPFSLPVMQMGFEKYLDLMFENSEYFDILMERNIEFCVEWSNAQLKAGATAICYFDPLSSPTITRREFYLKTGHIVAKKTLARINGPSAIHLASGRTFAVAEDIMASGTAAMGFSELDDAAGLKKKCAGKMALIGNLNGIKLCHASEAEIEASVKKVIMEAAPGGGFILSDNHGEIPWQVPEKNLFAIVNAVGEYGRYPIVQR